MLSTPPDSAGDRNPSGPPRDPTAETKPPVTAGPVGMPLPPPFLPDSEASAGERYRSFWAILILSVATIGVVLGLTWGHYLFGQAPHRLIKVLLGVGVATLFMLRPDWSLALLPFAFPFVEWLPKSPVPGLNAMNLIMASLLGGWVGKTIARRRRFFDGSPWNLWLPAFLLWAFFCWLRASVLYEGSILRSVLLFQNFWGGMSGLVLFFLVYNNVNTWKQIHTLSLLFCVGSAAGLLGLLRETRHLGTLERVGGGMGQENIAGAYFALALIFTIGLYPGLRGAFRRVVTGLAAAASAVAVVIPASRGAFIGFLGGSLVLALRNGIVWVLVLLGLVGAFYFGAPAYVKQRLTETEEAATTEGNKYDALNHQGGGRLDFWKASLEVIQANPLLGVGYGRIATALEPYLGRARPSHNLYLETAAELGIPGLLLLLWIMIIGWREAAALSRTPGFPRALGVAYRSALLCLGLSSIFGGRLFEFNMAGAVSFLTALVFRARALTREGIRDEESEPGALSAPAALPEARP